MACASRVGNRASHDKAKPPYRAEDYREVATRPREREEPRSDDDDKGAHPRRWSPEEDERLRASVEKYHGTSWKDIAAEVKSRNHVQCLQRWKKVLTPGLVKGQWSQEEDELLTAVVDEGHKNWGTLAARIPGRTSKQCRERWCHHLDPRIVKGKWTAEEDQIIVSMQEEMGNKWATIAQHLDGRTENATKIRWKILERNMKNGHDIHKHEKLPSVSSVRHNNDVRLRCLAAQAAASVMSKASEDVSPIGIPEDPTMVQNVLKENFGSVDTSRRAPFSKTRKGPQAASTVATTGESTSSAAVAEPKEEARDSRGNKKRKMQEERVDVSLLASFAPGDDSAEAKSGGGGGEGHCGRRGWLPEEDERLRQAVEKLGEKNWRYVAQSVGTRTHIQCQQRWKKALRPGLVKGAWSLEEDENLVTLIGQGFGNWSELATHTPGRTAKQCRERWCHHLDPSVNHGSWTQEEDGLLCSLEARLGTKWAAIAREMPGRTEHAVKGRFKTLSRERRVGGAGSHVGRVDKGSEESSPQEEVVRIDARMSSMLDAQPPAVPTSQTQQSGEYESSYSDARAGPVVSEAAPSPLFLEPSPSGSPGKRYRAISLARDPSAGGSRECREEALQQMQQGQYQQQSTDDSQQLMELALGKVALTTKAPEPNKQEDRFVETRLQSESDSAVEIARLLSVSSSVADPMVALPEITSGCCGSGRSSNTQPVAVFSSLAPQHSAADQHLAMVQPGKGGLQLAQRGHGPAQSQSQGEEGPRDATLPYRSATEDKLLPQLPLQKDPCPTTWNTGLVNAVASVGEASSLANKPSVVDYSDLASILIDGFDAHKDGVGPESEFVTLGEDPYSDYSISATPIIMQYPVGSRIGTPEEQMLPRADRQEASFGDMYDDMLGIPSDLTEALAAGVFDAGDPCDPYF